MIYEYECTNEKCGKVIEVLEKLNSKKFYDELCPDCKYAMKRIVSKSTFHLKGGNWGPKTPIGNDYDASYDEMIDQAASREIVR